MDEEQIEKIDMNEVHKEFHKTNKTIMEVVVDRINELIDVVNNLKPKE